MRLKGISLLLPVLFLILALVLFAAVREQTEDPLAKLSFTDTARGLPLSPRLDTTSGQYTLYLPAYLSAGDVSLSTPWYISAEFSPEAGLEAPEGTPLTLTLATLWGSKKSFPFRVLRCSTDMTVHLEVKGNTIEYLNADQTHEGKVFTQFLDGAGQTQYQGRAVMTGRGNGTWQWDKKPYNLEFSQGIDLGPFRDIDKLCLLAEYFDSTKLRNAMSYHMGQALEIPYASDYIFADVFINGQYNGVYGITTKKEYTKYIQEDGIQAVFELSTSGKGYELYTDMGKTVRLRYGDEALVQYAVECMEEALLSQDWEALYQCIDRESWARKYAMDELLYNYDLSLTSEYFYIGRDGKIRCMLPWDYEWVLYPRLYPRDVAEETALSIYWNRTNWYELLMEDPSFRAATAQVLREEFTDALWEDLAGWLTERAREVSSSVYCDYAIWRFGAAPSPDSPERGTQLEGYIAAFLQGLKARREYLLDVCQRWEDYCLVFCMTQTGETLEPAKVQLFLPRGTDLTAYLPRLRQSLETPEGYASAGWVTASGAPADSLTTLTEDITLTAVYTPLVQAADAPAREDTPEAVPARPSLPEPLKRALAIIRYYRTAVLILVPFLGLCLALAAGEIRRLWREKKAKARKELSAPLPK